MDRIPEIMDGKNVADFVDEDIDAKLALLEQEEEQLQVWEKKPPPPKKKPFITLQCVY